MAKGGVRQWLQQFSAIGRAMKWNESIKKTTCKALTRAKENSNALMKLESSSTPTAEIKDNVKPNADMPSEDLTGSQQMHLPRMGKDKGRRGVFRQLNKKRYDN